MLSIPVNAQINIQIIFTGPNWRSPQNTETLKIAVMNTITPPGTHLNVPLGCRIIL